nr:hypothetical protein [Burkholderia glumae]
MALRAARRGSGGRRAAGARARAEGAAWPGPGAVVRLAARRSRRSRRLGRLGRLRRRAGRFVGRPVARVCLRDVRSARPTAHPPIDDGVRYPAGAAVAGGHGGRRGLSARRLRQPPIRGRRASAQGIVPRDPAHAAAAQGAETGRVDRGRGALAARRARDRTAGDRRLAAPRVSARPDGRRDLHGRHRPQRALSRRDPGADGRDLRDDPARHDAGRGAPTARQADRGGALSAQAGDGLELALARERRQPGRVLQHPLRAGRAGGDHLAVGRGGGAVGRVARTVRAAMRRVPA